MAPGITFPIQQFSPFYVKCIYELFYKILFFFNIMGVKHILFSCNRKIE